MTPISLLAPIFSADRFISSDTCNTRHTGTDQLNCGILKLDIDSLGLHEQFLLEEQIALDSGQNLSEVPFGQWPQGNSVRQPAQQLGHEIVGLGQVEGSGADEEDVRGVDVTELRGDRGALDQWQEVSLHALGARVLPHRHSILCHRLLPGSALPCRSRQ